MAITRSPRREEFSQVQSIHNTAGTHLPDPSEIRPSGKRPREGASEADVQRQDSKRMHLADEDETIYFAKANIEHSIKHPQARSVSSRYADFLQSDHNQSTQNLVSAWLESFDADRERHSRSDSFLDINNTDKPEPPARPNSLPTPSAMSGKKDSDGFAVPAIPSPVNRAQSSRTESDRRTDSVQSGQSNLVNQVDYRHDNLVGCRIHLRKLPEQLPDHVAQLVQRMSAPRDPTEPSVDSIWNDRRLMSLSDPGVSEERIEAHFNAAIFDPDPASDLDRYGRGFMQRRLVPPTYNQYNMSVPVPDTILGYNEDGFADHQSHISSIRSEVKGTNNGLLFPFLIVEYKSEDAPLWVAVNQCLGGAACCVNLMEQFHAKLGRAGCEGLHPENRVVFSIAMNATLARVHATWFDNDKGYLTQQFRALSLQDPRQYIELYRFAKNIMDWGQTGRLREIREGLDRLMDAGALNMTYVPRSRRGSSAGSASWSEASGSDTKRARHS